MSKQVLISLAIAAGAFIAYLYIAVLIDTSEGNFFGYSAVFLGTNCLLVIMVIFLNSGVESASMEVLIETMEVGEARDSSRR